MCILTLYISTVVNDQNEQLYGSLCTNLTESQQVKLQQIFEHILTNQKTMTKEKLSCLLITSSSNASTPGIYFLHLLENTKLLPVAHYWDSGKLNFINSVENCR